MTSIISQKEENNDLKIVNKKKRKNLINELTPYEWYKKVLNSAKYILSPMVGQSELAFRLLCRNHGCQLAYTPMFISKLIVNDKKYRKAMFQTCKKDRPLIVQLCGNDPIIMLKAAKKFEKYCDAIDINLGCPQKVAERGNYGAFLMKSQNELIYKIVKYLSDNLSIKVTCKIRRYDTYTKTLDYVKNLIKSGCSLLTIHPRLIHQREEVLADWNYIKKLKNDIKTIPIIANGDMWHSLDVSLCSKITNADGFMSAQGLLHNPALFEDLKSLKKKKEYEQFFEKFYDDINDIEYLRKRRKYGPFIQNSLSLSFDNNKNSKNTKKKKLAVFHCKKEDVIRQFEISYEYLELCQKYPVVHYSIIRRHIFFILFDCFQKNIDLYDLLCDSKHIQDTINIINQLYNRAKSATTYTKQNQNKIYTRRRDGTLSPPKWPMGGGNRGIVSKDG